jgi:hypothetical protein
MGVYNDITIPDSKFILSQSIENSLSRFDQKTRQEDIFIRKMFPQFWSDSSTGFNREASDEPKPTYTVVVEHGETGECCVMIDGIFAYKVTKPNQAFHRDASAACMMGAKKYKGQYENQN